MCFLTVPNVFFTVPNVFFKGVLTIYKKYFRNILRNNKKSPAGLPQKEFLYLDYFLCARSQRAAGVQEDAALAPDLLRTVRRLSWIGSGPGL